MIVIETNSCPSGQKSMPILSETDEHNEHGGYRTVIESAFKEQLSKADPKLGELAVIYDKNEMESSGYAAVLADVAQEDVWLVEWYDNDSAPNVKWQEGVLHVRDQDNGKFLIYFYFILFLFFYLLFIYYAYFMHIITETTHSHFTCILTIFL